MLRQLRVVISTLPSSIPPATATDLIATFAVDPITLVAPGQDAWKDVIHNIFDALRYDEGRSRNALQLSQVIRQGDLGMSSGAKTTADLPLVPLDPITRVISPKPKALTTPMGCPGQELPLDGKTSFPSYPLAVHAHQELPWSVEFGRKLIIRSDHCVKGIIVRNEDGNNPGTTFAYLTMGDTQSLLRKKNSQIHSLKLAGLTLSQTLLVRATHLAAHSHLMIAVSRGDVPRIHSIVARCRKNGDSISTCVEKIGRRRCFGLPAISTAKRHVATVPLKTSPRAPSMQEMLQNLDTAFHIPHPPPSDGSVGPGFQIMIDDIKVEGRMRWDPGSNMILGLCREHIAEFELNFLGVEQAEALHAGLAKKGSTYRRSSLLYLVRWR
ncbi:hypothetical protein B0H13DRAFT_1867697 [Mycena leptocephala]|nr:hypothetical protein B0H13DRAFT_1867697 [Mycena leptocephala]